MKMVISLILFLSGCTLPENGNQDFFPLITVDSEEWAAYEGKWLTQDGVIRFELFLKAGAAGVDSYYELHELFERSDSTQSWGTTSHGLYSTYRGLPHNVLGIRLHELSMYDKSVYLRYNVSQSLGMHDEMFFVTRGQDELLPCDDSFKPITEDWHYTLHKRSKLFTVEGYLTIERDSIDFYERNVFEHWSLAELGEFNEVKEMHSKLAKEKYEGIYLKALAYSVLDTSATKGERSLAVKRILSFNQDPD